MGQYDWVIGVSFSFASSLLSCLGLIFQKYAHNQNQALPDDQKYPVVAGIVCSPCWWASFIMMGLFPFPFDFFAYSFAAQSLVAPFAGLTLIMNQFFAPLILKEKLYRIDIYASIVVFIGTTLTTVTGNHEEESYSLADLKSYFKRRSFYTASIILVLVVIAMILSLNLTDPLKSADGRAASPSLASSNVDSAECTQTYSATMHSHKNERPVGQEVDAEDEAGATVANDDDVRVDLGGARESAEAVPSFEPETKKSSSARMESSLELQKRLFNDAGASWSARAIAAAKIVNFSARPFYYGFIAGAFGGMQNIFFKSVGVLMKTSVFDGGESAWGSWEPYIFIIAVIVLALNQLSFLNKGMSRFDAVLVFPLYNACYIFLSVSLGALYFGEFDGLSTKQLVLFPLGVLITLVGIIMFIFKPRNTTSEAGRASAPKSAAPSGADETSAGSAADRPSSAPRDPSDLSATRSNSRNHIDLA